MTLREYAEDHIEAKEELERLKREGKYISLSSESPSYDGETEIDERVY